MDYDKLFALYQTGDLETLIKELLRCVRSWANDVLQCTSQAKNWSWRKELISAGLVEAHRQLTKHSEVPIVSGKHLVNRLRKPLKKAMRRAWRELFVGPIKIGHNACDQVTRGEAAYFASWPLVPLQIDCKSVVRKLRRQEWTDDLISAAIVDSVTDSDSDEQESRRMNFVKLASDAACIEAQQRGWLIVDVMRSEGITTSEMARRSNIPRSTLRDRLKRLRLHVAATASPKLDELGEEFLKNTWISAAKKGREGHRNNGGPPGANNKAA
jgi:hypothetical protein